MRTLAIVASLLAMLAGPVAAQEAPDWRVFIEEGDWTFVTETDGMVSLARRHPTNPHLVEFRYEYEDGEFARRFGRVVEAFPAYLKARSMTAVAEFDCEGQRKKSHRESLYPGRNLTGEVLLTRDNTRNWLPIEAGTMGFDQFRWACTQ